MAVASNKFVNREITHTTVKLSRIEMVDGHPQAKELPDEKLTGNVPLDKAQSHMNFKFRGQKPVTVVQVIPETTKFRMPLDRFMKLAEVVTEGTDDSGEVYEKDSEETSTKEVNEAKKELNQKFGKEVKKESNHQQFNKDTKKDTKK